MPKLASLSIIGVKLIILDEPNANLDEEGDAALEMALRTARNNRVTVILVTQRPRALNIVDKILRLHGGSVDFFGSRAEFVAKLKELKQKAMQQRAARQAKPGQQKPVSPQDIKKPAPVQGNQTGSIIAHQPVNPVVQSAFGSHIKVQNER